jgi:hypothetical protein
MVEGGRAAYRLTSKVNLFLGLDDAGARGFVLGVGRHLLFTFTEGFLHIHDALEERHKVEEDIEVAPCVAFEALGQGIQVEHM